MFETRFSHKYKDEVVFKGNLKSDLINNEKHNCFEYTFIFKAKDLPSFMQNNLEHYTYNIHFVDNSPITCDFHGLDIQSEQEEFPGWKNVKIFKNKTDDLTATVSVTDLPKCQRCQKHTKLSSKHVHVCLRCERFLIESIEEIQFKLLSSPDDVELNKKKNVFLFMLNETNGE